jgi:hypothetical protein
VKPDELKGLAAFLAKCGSGYGIVVTRDMFMAQDNIYFIPAWLFLVL